MTGQTIVLSTDRQRQLAKQLVDRAPPRAVLNIREAKRTNAQNSKMQAMLSDIARQRPGGRVLTTERWKCVFMDAVAEETGNKAFTPEWIPSLDGKRAVNAGYRSSRLRVAEMGELIDFMDAWGAENGIQFSDDSSTNQQGNAASA